MPKETPKNIEKLLSLVNADKIVSQEEIEDLLQAIIGILADNKKAVEGLNAETKEYIKKAITQIMEDHSGVMQQLKKDATSTKAAIEKSVKEQNDRAFKRLQSLIDNLKQPRDGKDGKDGKELNEDVVVEKVLAKIKLPENKVVTSQDVKVQLETLGDDDKDALFTLLGSKKLKSIDDSMEQRFADALNRIRLTSGKVKTLVAGSNVTVTNDGNGNYTVSSTAGSSVSEFIDLTDVPSSYTGHGQKFVKVTAGEDGLEFVAGSGVSTEWGDITGTLSNQTDLQAALDAKTIEAIAFAIAL